jgi:hypothetical protein
MMTGYSPPSSPSGELSIEYDDPPVASIVTGSRKKKRKYTEISAITPTNVGLGANHRDHSDIEGSPVSESEAIYAELKNIVGTELLTEIKQLTQNDPKKKQQFVIEQNGSPGFDLSGIPVDYVCFPIDKFLHLFEAFKCPKCHERHKPKKYLGEIWLRPISLLYVYEL